MVDAVVELLSPAGREFDSGERMCYQLVKINKLYIKYI